MAKKVANKSGDISLTTTGDNKVADATVATTKKKPKKVAMVKEEKMPVLADLQEQIKPKRSRTVSKNATAKVAETESVVVVQTEVLEEKTKKKTKQATTTSTGVKEAVEQPEVPNKRVARKKTKVSDEPDKATAIETAPQKPKRASKNITTSDVATITVSQETLPQATSTVPEQLVTSKKSKSKTTEQNIDLIDVQPVVADLQSDNVAILPPTGRSKQKNKKGQSNKTTIIETTTVIVSQPTTTSQNAEGVTEPAKPLSKSARRRAKRKAKKLREQTALLQTSTSVESAIMPQQADIVNKSESKPTTNEQVPTKKGKRGDNHKKKSMLLSNSHKDATPIYSNQDTNSSVIVHGKTMEIPNEKTQYVSHRKLHPKPIPWADLSKLQNEKKQVVVKESIEIVPIDSSKLLTSVQRRDPFFQNFYRDIERFVISEMLIENGSKVLVAVSGGVDSVVMLDVFANLAAKYNFIVYVAHYNHNLRGDASEVDANFVKSLAASYNLPLYASTGKVLQHAERTGMSVEESARFLRYYFLERTACTLKADFVATAHTADDSAETFLLNLFRGTGLTGLSGIPSRRQLVKDVIIIRPFLNIPKQKLKEYAEKRNLEWHEDETNLQDKYTRNKIRNNLIPQLKLNYTPSIIDVVNRSAKLIQGADRIIHDYVRTHLPSIVFDISNDSISVKLTLFKTFDEFIRGEMLQTMLMKYFKLLPLPMKIIDRIIKLEQSETGSICEISKNIIAIRDRQVLIITRKITPNKINQKIEKKGKFVFNNISFVLKEIDVKDVEFIQNPCVEYFDSRLVSSTLLVRNWEHGDDFTPLGMEHTMKLSDFLINEKVSVLEKPNVLVLTNNNEEIIWVCKHRINDKFKITENTKKVLRIEIKEKQK